MTPTSSATSPRAELLGPAFAHALSRRDFAQVAEVLSPDIEFAALTPRRAWDAPSAEEAVRVTAHLVQRGDGRRRRAGQSASDVVGDRHCVTYRFAGERAGERFVIEQHAYYTERDDRIGWMRLLCSGFRPAG